MQHRGGDLARFAETAQRHLRLDLRGGGFEIVEVKVPSEAAVVGQRLRDVLLPQQSLISLVIDTDGVPRVPTSDTVIEADDELIAVTKMENEGKLRSILTSSDPQA